MVEGVGYTPGAPGGDDPGAGFWWGENLVGARVAPVQLKDQSKLVYSPHVCTPLPAHGSLAARPCHAPDMCLCRRDLHRRPISLSPALLYRAGLPEQHAGRLGAALCLRAGAGHSDRPRRDRCVPCSCGPGPTSTQRCTAALRDRPFSLRCGTGGLYRDNDRQWQDWAIPYIVQRGFGVFSACSCPCRTPSPLHPPSPLRHLQVFYFALNPDSEDTVCEHARSLPRTLDLQTLLGTMGE